MGFWTARRGWHILVLTLATFALVLGSALAAYADSTGRSPAEATLLHAQGDGTPAAPVEIAPTGAEASSLGAESAVLGSTTQITPTVTPTTPPPTRTPTRVPSPVNVIKNGGFEEGFVEGQGVGVGWGRFQNGNVFAGWYDDTWTKVVYEGKHAQLLELTKAQELDRYAGIFQTVDVVPNADYVLTLHGLVRSDAGSIEASNYGFRMQYGIDYTGGSDWQSSNIKWIELPWDEQPRTDPTGDQQYRMESYTATIKTTGPKLTLFIRGWKKWADGVEGNYDIDGVSLVGPQAGAAPPPPTATTQPGMPVTGNQFSFFDNPVVVVPSIALLIILVGGATWGLTRRRA